jgi:hypothetical protein
MHGEQLKHAKTMVLGAIVLIMVVMASAAGCTGASEKQTPAAPQTTSSDADSASSSSSSSPPSSSVPAVSYTELQKFLPAAPGGWQIDDKSGVTYKADGEDWSSAWAAYSRTDNSDITAAVYIQDTAGMREGYWEMWDMATVVETDDFSWKSTTMAGNPAWEFIDKTSDGSALYVGIKDRIIVVVNVDGGSKDDLYAFANPINYGGLAALT